MSAEAETAALLARLRRAWKKEQHFHHTRGLCFLVVWLIALVVLDLVVDWLFLIPGYGRWVLLGINAAVVAWVVWHHWLRYLRRYDPVRTALKVERRHPELRSLLVSFVQLRDDAATARYASPALIRAVRRQTIEYTRPIDFREIVSYRELRRIFTLAACVVAFFAVISVNWSGHLRVLAYRLLHPEARIGYPTRTKIEAITGNISVQQGRDVTLEVRAGGLVPREGSLYVKPRNGAWERLRLAPADAPNRFAYTFEEVYQSFEYRVRLGDASSEVYAVNVVPPPRILQAEVTLTYPAYAGQKPRTLDVLNLEVPEGTRIAWRLRCDRPLEAAEMVRDEDQAEPLELSEDGTVASLTLEADASFSYQFRWTERQHHYRYEEDVHYFVQVVPDTAPQVEILRPLEDIKATTRKTLTILFQARDDYGLSKANIVYSLNGGEERTRPIGGVEGRLVETNVSWKLADSIPDLKVGDIITYYVQVFDNHDSAEGPYSGVSQTRRVYIVSVPEYLRYMAERRRKLVAEIRELHTQETDAAEEIEKVKTGELETQAIENRQTPR